MSAQSRTPPNTARILALEAGGTLSVLGALICMAALTAYVAEVDWLAFLSILWGYSDSWYDPTYSDAWYIAFDIRLGLISITGLLVLCWIVWRGLYALRYLRPREVNGRILGCLVAAEAYRLRLHSFVHDFVRHAIKALCRLLAAILSTQDRLTELTHQASRNVASAHELELLLLNRLGSVTAY